MGQRKVVFTAGSGRGGTTLLNLILGSHSRGFALGELFGLPEQIEQTGGRPCRLCEDACPIWSADFMDGILSRHWPGAGQSAADWVAAMTPRWPALARRPSGPGLYAELFGRIDADILFDSSKSLHWIDGRLADRRDWTEARPYLIVITRDGRAVVNSFLRKSPKVPVEEHIGNWQSRMARLEEMFAAFPADRRMRLSYEFLAQEPELAVRRICDVLGIAFEPGMLEYWRHEHHTLGGNKGTQYAMHEARGAVGDGQAPRQARLDHYRQAGAGIQLDERWRDEMPPEALETFRKIAGAMNASYAHGT